MRGRCVEAARTDGVARTIDGFDDLMEAGGEVEWVEEAGVGIVESVVEDGAVEGVDAIVLLVCEMFDDE